MAVKQPTKQTAPTLEERIAKLLSKAEEISASLAKEALAAQAARTMVLALADNNGNPIPVMLKVSGLKSGKIVRSLVLTSPGERYNTTQLFGSELRFQTMTISVQYARDTLMLPDMFIRIAELLTLSLGEVVAISAELF